MLKQKVINSISWLFFSQVLREILQFIISIILARLLMPKDYGLVSMSATFLNFFLVFNMFGFQSALIQKQHIKNEHYSTAFWTTILLGVILFLITFAISPLIAAFFKEPLLQKIVVVSALIFIINPLKAIHFAILEKSLALKRFR